ncbi:hypothetical protein OF83DRAFT_1165187 [Amylostereum chailletii]|nr:hypothetical protein OF83DRAFT_1165187 [Amylostereum chailletii]
MDTAEIDIHQASLPTLDRLKVSLAPDAEIDAPQIARDWLVAFATHAAAADVPALLSLFLPDAFWRDMLSLTWDFRTFYGAARLATFLRDRLPPTQITRVTVDPTQIPVLQRPYPDIAWIQALFTFDTAVGPASGIVRLVPTSEGAWKAHAVFTTLEGLHGHPERLGPLRAQAPSHGKWEEQRRREIECEGEDQQPKVLVVGGGQCGLDIAARLKYLGIKTLVVDKEARVGQMWRKRYEALCLHDPVWYDHMPYLPFPPTWPVYTPAQKMADWLEHYAHDLELDIWTSTTVTDARQDPETLKWTVTLEREVPPPQGTEPGDRKRVKRTFVVNHLVFAVGMGGGSLNIPKYPGMDEYKGKIVHSGAFTTGRDYVGKKVVVVGACTSDVTMFQRGSTYVVSARRGFGDRLIGGASPLGLYHEGGPLADVADRINASFPHYFLKLVHQRIVKDIAATTDKETLDGLRRIGFRLNYGIDGSGFLLLAWGKAGGYYLGEIHGAWRDMGVPRLYCMMEIKAIEEGIFDGTRYSLE